MGFNINTGSNTPTFGSNTTIKSSGDTILKIDSGSSTNYSIVEFYRNGVAKCYIGHAGVTSTGINITNYTAPNTDKITIHDTGYIQFDSLDIKVGGPVGSPTITTYLNNANLKIEPQGTGLVQLKNETTVYDDGSGNTYLYVDGSTSSSINFRDNSGTLKLLIRHTGSTSQYAQIMNRVNFPSWSAQMILSDNGAVTIRSENNQVFSLVSNESYYNLYGVTGSSEGFLRLIHYEDISYAEGIGPVIDAIGYYDTSLTSNFARIFMVKDNSTQGNNSGRIEFRTTLNGAGNREAFRITPNGDISFGSTISNPKITTQATNGSITIEPIGTGKTYINSNIDQNNGDDTYLKILSNIDSNVALSDADGTIRAILRHTKSTANYAEFINLLSAGFKSVVRLYDSGSTLLRASDTGVLNLYCENNDVRVQAKAGSGYGNFRIYELQTDYLAGRGAIIDCIAPYDIDLERTVVQILGVKENSTQGDSKGTFYVKVHNGTNLVQSLIIDSSSNTNITVGSLQMGGTNVISNSRVGYFTSLTEVDGGIGACIFKIKGGTGTYGMVQFLINGSQTAFLRYNAGTSGFELWNYVSGDYIFMRDSGIVDIKTDTLNVGRLGDSTISSYVTDSNLYITANGSGKVYLKSTTVLQGSGNSGFTIDSNSAAATYAVTYFQKEGTNKGLVGWNNNGTMLYNYGSGDYIQIYDSGSILLYSNTIKVGKSGNTTIATYPTNANLNLNPNGTGVVLTQKDLVTDSTTDTNLIARSSASTAGQGGLIWDQGSTYEFKSYCTGTGGSTGVLYIQYRDKATQTSQNGHVYFDGIDFISINPQTLNPYLALLQAGTTQSTLVADVTNSKVSLISYITNGDIELTPNGTGNVNISVGGLQVGGTTVIASNRYMTAAQLTVQSTGAGYINIDSATGNSSLIYFKENGVTKAYTFYTATNGYWSTYNATQSSSYIRLYDTGATYLASGNLNDIVLVPAGNVNISQNNLEMAGTQVLTSRQIGWTAATGTATRSGFATSTVTLQTLAEHVKALIDDLITHGLIGT